MTMGDVRHVEDSKQSATLKRTNNPYKLSGGDCEPKIADNDIVEHPRPDASNGAPHLGGTAPTFFAAQNGECVPGGYNSNTGEYDYSYKPVYSTPHSAQCNYSANQNYWTSQSGFGGCSCCNGANHYWASRGAFGGGCYGNSDCRNAQNTVDGYTYGNCGAKNAYCGFQDYCEVQNSANIPAFGLDSQYAYGGGNSDGKCFPGAPCADPCGNGDHQYGTQPCGYNYDHLAQPAAIPDTHCSVRVGAQPYVRVGHQSIPAATTSIKTFEGPPATKKPTDPLHGMDRSDPFVTAVMDLAPALPNLSDDQAAKQVMALIRSYFTNAGTQYGKYVPKEQLGALTPMYICTKETEHKEGDPLVAWGRLDRYMVSRDDMNRALTYLAILFGVQVVNVDFHRDGNMALTLVPEDQVDRLCKRYHHRVLWAPNGEGFFLENAGPCRFLDLVSKMLLEPIKDRIGNHASIQTMTAERPKKYNKTNNNNNNNNKDSM